jgi:hypothetical protein
MIVFSLRGYAASLLIQERGVDTAQNRHRAGVSILRDLQQPFGLMVVIAVAPTMSGFSFLIMARVSSSDGSLVIASTKRMPV